MTALHFKAKARWDQASPPNDSINVKDKIANKDENGIRNLWYEITFSLFEISSSPCPNFSLLQFTPSV